jgi:hypothetical protein
MMQRFILMFLVVLAGPALAAADAPIPPYTATYEAQALGNRLVALSTLHYEGDHIRMAMDAHVSGFLRILGRFEFNRESLIQSNGTAVRLLQNRSQQVTPRRERKVETRFDWVTHHAHGHINGKAFDLAVPATTQDFLSSLYLTMVLLRNGDLTTLRLDLLERNHLRSYALERRGEARIATPLGTLDTVHVVRTNQGSNVELAAWFAPELHYLPVRFDYEADGNVYRLDLTQLEWHQPLADRQEARP